VTLLEALQAQIAGQLISLDDPSLTGTGQSSAEMLGTSGAVVAEKLTSHLLREIVVRAAQGGPLSPLAAQLNHDATHLQGQRIEKILGRLDNEVRKALARLDVGQAAIAAQPDDQRSPTAANREERTKALPAKHEAGSRGAAGPASALKRSRVAKDNETLVEPVDPALTPTRIAAFRDLGHLGTLAFSPQGRILATHTFTGGGGGENGKVILWDITDLTKPTRTATLTHRSHSLYRMAFSPDGRTLATTAKSATDDRSFELILWDIAEPAQPTKVFTLTGCATAVAFSPNEHIMAIAGSNRPNGYGGEITLWDLTSPTRSRFRKSRAPVCISTVTWPDHIKLATFSPDGGILAIGTGAANGAVFLWNVVDPAEPTRLATVAPFTYVGTVVFLPDGRTMATRRPHSRRQSDLVGHHGRDLLGGRRR
jgi:WD40 repeat protein